jgi:hypothetical protein
MCPENLPPFLRAIRAPHDNLKDAAVILAVVVIQRDRRFLPGVPRLASVAVISLY